MAEETEQETTEQAQSEYKDRSTWLTVFGIGEMIMGVLAALMVPLMLFSFVAGAALGDQGGPRMDARWTLASVGVYVVAAVFFGWMGFGTLKGRRWARAIMLVTGWMWLIGGLLGMVMMFSMLPHMFDIQAPGARPMPEAAKTMMMIVIGAFLLVIYVLLPGAFVLFYGRKDVKATFETRDPTPRWTDACPLPILAMTFALGLAAASCLLGLMYAIVPLFGSLLTGLPAVVILLLLAAFLAFLTIQTYRRRPQAWFATLGLVVVGGLSQIITFAVHDLNDLYAAMGYSQEMLDMMSQITERMPMNIPLMSGAYAGVLLALLLYVRRFFDFAPAQDDSPPDDA